MNDKIDQRQCSCKTGNNMDRLEAILCDMQTQKTLDRQEMKQQMTEIKNMNKAIPQSTPLSDVPRFHQNNLYHRMSPLQENYVHQDPRRQSHDIPPHVHTPHGLKDEAYSKRELQTLSDAHFHFTDK